MRRGLLGALAVAAACLIAVAGASSASAATAKGAPLRIGAICTCSGPEGGAQSSFKAYLDAWVKWTNANGGVNGHPVKIYFADDSGDATKSGTAVRGLIGRDKVQAIAGYFSTQGSAWAAEAQKAGVPVIGSPSTSPAEYSNPMFFPTGMNQIVAGYGVLNAAKVYDVRRISVLYCAESPVCGQLPGIFAGLSRLVGGGVEVTTSAKISASQPSYAAQCLAAKDARATAAIIPSDANVVLRLLQQCKEQGWTPFALEAGGSFGHNDAAKVKGLRVSLSTAGIGVEDTTTAGGKLFHKIMAKYAPGIPKSKGFNANVGVANASLEMFRKAATEAKLTPASKPSVLVKGLYSLKNETLGGLIGPITYTKGKPTFGSCWFYNTYNHDKWRINTKPQCLTGAKLAALKAAVGAK